MHFYKSPVRNRSSLLKFQILIDKYLKSWYFYLENFPGNVKIRAQLTPAKTKQLYFALFTWHKLED